MKGLEAARLLNKVRTLNDTHYVDIYISPVNHPHTTCTVTDFRVPIPAASLNKHLRFEARVATQ